MTKGVVFFLIGGIMCWMILQFSTNPLDASGDPLYAELLKKRLKTNKDLYLIDFGAPDELTLGDSQCISSELPEKPGSEDVGKEYGNIKIRGFVPKGSHVDIVSVKKNINTAAELIGKIEGFDEYIDLSFTQDYRGDTGTFKEGYYEEMLYPGSN